MAELTDRLRIFAVAGRQNEQIGVDTDTTAAYAEAPVAGVEVTEVDATATGVRTRSPTMPDALSGGEESLNREAVILLWFLYVVLFCAILYSSFLV